MSQEEDVLTLSECTVQGSWIEVRGEERWGVDLLENWLADL